MGPTLRGAGGTRRCRAVDSGDASHRQRRCAGIVGHPRPGSERMARPV